MKAKEARELSLKSIVSNTLEKELDKLISQIKKECENQNTILFIDYEITKMTINKLQSWGYKVEKAPQLAYIKDGTKYIIEW